MSDPIDRQAAIDVVVFECGEWAGLAGEISKQLRQLPSAQPETNHSEIPNNWIPCSIEMPILDGIYIVDERRWARVGFIRSAM